jgi:hypothetical protein
MSKKVLLTVLVLLATIIIISTGCSTLKQLCIAQCEEQFNSKTKTSNQVVKESVDKVIEVQCEELCSVADDYCIPLCEVLGLPDCDVYCDGDKR